MTATVGRDRCHVALQSILNQHFGGAHGLTPARPHRAGAFPVAGQLKLLVSPSEMTKISLKGLLRAFEIRPSIETVALGKSGFMGMQ